MEKRRKRKEEWRRTFWWCSFFCAEGGVEEKKCLMGWLSSDVKELKGKKSFSMQKMFRTSKLELNTLSLVVV